MYPHPLTSLKRTPPQGSGQRPGPGVATVLPGDSRQSLPRAARGHQSPLPPLPPAQYHCQGGWLCTVGGNGGGRGGRAAACTELPGGQLLPGPGLELRKSYRRYRVAESTVQRTAAWAATWRETYTIAHSAHTVTQAYGWQY
eukprot:753374-Hanusia_phi.AAC.17